MIIRCWTSRDDIKSILIPLNVRMNRCPNGATQKDPVLIKCVMIKHNSHYNSLLVCSSHVSVNIRDSFECHHINHHFNATIIILYIHYVLLHLTSSPSQFLLNFFFCRINCIEAEQIIRHQDLNMEPIIF